MEDYYLKKNISISLVILFVLLFNFTVKSTELERTKKYVEDILNKDIDIIKINNSILNINNQIESINKKIPQLKLSVKLKKNQKTNNILLSLNKTKSYENKINISFNLEKSGFSGLNHNLSISKKIYPIYNKKEIESQELLLSKKRKILERDSLKIDLLIDLLNDLSEYYYLKKQLIIKKQRLNLIQSIQKREKKINDLLDGKEDDKKIELEQMQLKILSDKNRIKALKNKRSRILISIKSTDKENIFYTLLRPKDYLDIIWGINKRIINWKTIYHKQKDLYDLKWEYYNKFSLPQISINCSYDSFLNEELISTNIKLSSSNQEIKNSKQRLVNDKKLLIKKKKETSKDINREINNIRNTIILEKQKLSYLKIKEQKLINHINNIKRKIYLGISNNYMLDKRQNEIQRLDNEINYLKQQIYIRELHLFLKKALYRQ